MLRPRSIPFALALATACTVAQAAGEPPAIAQSACLDSATTTAGMQDCVASENKTQDARLNRLYRALIAQQSSASQKAQLQAAQRQWLKFRDANCVFYAASTGGSMATLAADECVRATTTRRADELEQLLRP
ncbi:MAG: lysozyme inhibitor LprI family protein [Comamonas sp.]